MILILGGTALMVSNQTAAQGESFHMFNALWFEEGGGAAKYNEYLAAAGPFVAKHGDTSDASYVPEGAVIGAVLHLGLLLRERTTVSGSLSRFFGR